MEVDMAVSYAQFPVETFYLVFNISIQLHKIPKW